MAELRQHVLLPSSEALDHMQGASTGRLLSYSPQTGKTRVLTTGIFYANGVALSQDESYLLLAETGALRILRIWLEGPKVRACSHHPLSFPPVHRSLRRVLGGSHQTASLPQPYL